MYVCVCMCKVHMLVCACMCEVCVHTYVCPPLAQEKLLIHMVSDNALSGTI